MIFVSMCNEFIHLLNTLIQRPCCSLGHFFNQRYSYHACLTKAPVPPNTQDYRIFDTALAQRECTCTTHIVSILLTVAAKMPTWDHESNVNIIMFSNECLNH